MNITQEISHSGKGQLILPADSSKKEGYKEFHEFVHESFRPDLWYINTLAHPHLLEYARLNNIPCIVHSHETSLSVYSLSGRDVDNLVSTPG